MNLENISKYMCLILRHKPETIGITLDEHGWANVDELIDGIRKDNPGFDLGHLYEIVKTDSKGRYSFNEDKTLGNFEMKAPLNPPMGDFFRMSLCNVFLLPLYFSSDFSIRVLTCIIQHGQKANRVKMNGYAALSAFCPCCIFYARKPR